MPDPGEATTIREALHHTGDRVTGGERHGQHASYCPGCKGDAALDSLLARLADAERERDEAQQTVTALAEVTHTVSLKLLTEAHSAWLDGRPPDLSNERYGQEVENTLREMYGHGGGVTSVRALRQQIGALEEALRANVALADEFSADFKGTEAGKQFAVLASRLEAAFAASGGAA